MQAGDAQAALGEYAILTEIEPHTASHFEFAAAAAHKLGDSIKVEQYARRAVELDPESAARSFLP